MICHSRPIHSSRRVIYEKAPGQQRGKWAERGMGQRRHCAQTGQRRGWVKKRGDRQPSRGAREEEICSRSQCESVVWSFVIWGGYPSWEFLCLKVFENLYLSLFFFFLKLIQACWIVSEFSQTKCRLIPLESGCSHWTWEADSIRFGESKLRLASLSIQGKPFRFSILLGQGSGTLSHTA